MTKSCPINRPFPYSIRKVKMSQKEHLKIFNSLALEIRISSRALGWGSIHCFEGSTRRDNYWLCQAGHCHEDDRIRFEIVRTILMIKMLMMITMRIVVMMVTLAVINQCSQLANKLINSICSVQSTQKVTWLESYVGIMWRWKIAELLTGSGQCHQSVMYQSWMFMPRRAISGE